MDFSFNKIFDADRSDDLSHLNSRAEIHEVDTIPGISGLYNALVRMWSEEQPAQGLTKSLSVFP